MYGFSVSSIDFWFYRTHTIPIYFEDSSKTDFSFENLPLLESYFDLKKLKNLILKY